MDSRTALSELKAFQGSRKGAGDYYTQYQQELGVGDAQARQNDIRGLIRNTETALKGVNQSVAGRTRGQGVNEAQRARLEGIERAPIAEELGSLQGTYADENQNYRDLLGQATTRAGQAYQTDADRLAALESNYNKIYQSEQAAAEAARWEREMAQRQAQFEADLRERQRASAANEAAIRAQFAQQASLGTAAQQAAQKESERQKALEEQARQVRQGAESAAKNPRKEANLWDEWWRPMGNSLNAFAQPMANSIGQVQKWFGL